MHKIENISLLEPYKILCHFTNGEKRVLDLASSLNDKYSKKIFSENQFNKVKLGSLGEIYWEGIGEIRGLNGEIEPCNYDISPEFAYFNSKFFESF